MTLIDSPVLSPLTQTADVLRVGKLLPAELIQAWKQNFGIDIAARLEGITAIDIYRCKKTDLVFFWPPDLEGDENLYQQLSLHDWYYMENKWEYDRAIEDFARCKRILEIGCGTGEFLVKLKKKGLEAEGLETNRQAAEVARAKGLTVFSQGMDQLNPEDPYDGVCFFQTLEHAADTHGFLNSALRLLKKGGTLAVSVPNHGAFLKDAKNSLLEQPPHHLTQWCESSLKSLTEIFPLGLNRILCEPLAVYHVEWYWNIQSQRIRGLGKFGQTALKKIGKKLCQFQALRRLIKGHTIYGSYKKTLTRPKT